MTITVFIRYEIDPFNTAAFEQYARNWRQAIPRCDADLIGYYAPHEGSSTIADGVYNIESLAAYEAYRARLAAIRPGARTMNSPARKISAPRGPLVPAPGLGAPCAISSAVIAVKSSMSRGQHHSGTQAGN